MEGLIICNISDTYIVKINNKEYKCKARGKFRYNKLTPLVGDRVLIDTDNLCITDIIPRKNYLLRPSVANIDIAFILVSTWPYLDTNLLDRLLTIINYNNIEAIICFSKLDKLDSKELEEVNTYITYYQSIGYKVYKNTDIDNIKNLFKDKITVFTGQSGSGKSTLLNKLDNNLNLKTDEISLSLGRGKHTTRHTELYELYNGYVVDTPGFSSLDFIGMTKLDIRDNYKECYDYLDKCKYRDCLHIKEDGCYVKEILSQGNILPSRYNNYVKYISEVQDK